MKIAIPLSIGLASLTLYSSCKEHTKKKQVNNLINRFKEDHGIPGIVLGISKNGRTIYKKGFGYSDVENNTKAHGDTLMRIASISKAITSLIAGKLVEDKQLDLDKSINDYLPNLKIFLWNDKEVKITSRHLLSHTSGIRHYEKNISLKIKDSNKPDDKPDSELAEFYSKQNYKNVQDSLELFLNDKLIFEPGKNYYYTTHGFTLASAVLEKIAEKSFSSILADLFLRLEMNNTFLDQNEPLIANRAKYYKRDKSHRLKNVPYVDNSNKWAGGGLVSTCGDLLLLGNHLLGCYQFDNETNLLKRDTIKLLWTPQTDVITKYDNSTEKQEFLKQQKKITYGLGWLLCHENDQLKYVYHTGGAVGCTSCLLIVPKRDEKVKLEVPNGYVVSVLCNSQDSRGILNLCLEVVKIFSS